MEQASLQCERVLWFESYETKHAQKELQKVYKTCKIMQTILCHILVYSNHQFTNLILNDLYYTYVPIGTCYLCTFPRTIKTGIGTCCGSSIHSFHLKSEFQIWHSTFGAITFHQFWFMIFFKVYLFLPTPEIFLGSI